MVFAVFITSSAFVLGQHIKSNFNSSPKYLFLATQTTSIWTAMSCGKAFNGCKEKPRAAPVMTAVHHHPSAGQHRGAIPGMCGSSGGWSGEGEVG